MGFQLSSFHLPGTGVRARRAWAALCVPRRGQKVAPQARRPRPHTALTRIPGPNLPVSVSAQPHPCPAPLWTFLAVRSSLPHPPPPRAHTQSWQPSGCPSVAALRQGPFPPGSCRTRGLGLPAHIQTCGELGSRGGSRWLPRWLVAFPPLSFSASLSLSRLALFSSLLQESPMRGVWTVWETDTEDT